MNHIASKVCDQHCLRLRSLQDWERVLWWMGLACFLLGALLICVGETVRGFLIGMLYTPIAIARMGCGSAIDREAERLRHDLLECVCEEKGKAP